MRYKNFFFFLIIFVIAVILFWQLSQKETSFDTTNKIQKNSSDIDIKDEFIEPKKLIQEVEKFENELKNLKVEKDFILNVDSEVFSPFTIIDIDEVKSIKKSDINPILAVSVDGDNLLNANIGDVVELPTIGGSNYQVMITDKKRNKSGSITISGNLVEDEKYSAVLTGSKKGLYGSITTPNGAYEIEIQNGKGYIYSVEDIEKKRVDDSKSDEIESDE